MSNLKNNIKESGRKYSEDFDEKTLHHIVTEYVVIDGKTFSAEGRSPNKTTTASNAKKSVSKKDK